MIYAILSGYMTTWHEHDNGFLCTCNWIESPRSAADIERRLAWHNYMFHDNEPVVKEPAKSEFKAEIVLPVE